MLNDLRVGRGTAVAALILIILTGVVVRTASFHRLGKGNRDLFFVESAQHYRYARMAAEGKPIPKTDYELEYPDGFNPWTDAVTAEIFFGWLYRLLGEPPIPLETFLRYLIRFWFTLTAIPIYLMARRVSGRRADGLIAALVFAIAFPSIRRSLGHMLLREHFAFPFLGFHLYFLLLALSEAGGESRGQEGEGMRLFSSRHMIYSVLTAAFFFIALTGWMVIRFYYLALVGYFLIEFILGRMNNRTALTLAVITGVNLVGSLTIPAHYYYSNFALSWGMILSYSILLGYLLWAYGRIPRWAAAAAVVALPLILHFGMDGGGRFDHVWQTLAAKLRYWNKPQDPSLLPFEARHYWVPPYDSPSLFSFLHDFFLPLGFASFTIVPLARRVLKRKDAPEQDLLLYIFAAFLGCYILFFKFMTFLILILSVLMGITLGGWLSRRERWAIGMVVLALFVGVEVEAAFNWTDSLPGRMWNRLGFKEREYPEPYTARSVHDLLNWIREESGEDAVFAADFGISTMIPTYAGRRVILHSFFESGMREKYREFSYALFGPEEELYAFCRKFDADYLIYGAHFLLRTDDNLSYRYITDNMEMDRGWVAYTMHFKPEELSRFELVYQNAFHRVFRVLREGEARRQRTLPYEPLFDLNLFRKLVFSNKNVRHEEAFLYTAVAGYKELDRAYRVMLREGVEKGISHAFRSVEIFDFIPRAHLLLGEYYMEGGDPERAAREFRRVLSLDPNSPEARDYLQKLADSPGDGSEP